MKRHLATALGALLFCLAGPALGQLPKGPAGPGPDLDVRRIIDLSINKRVMGPVIAGQSATFVLDVANSGNSAVNASMGIQVVDALPNGFTGPFTGSGSGWSCGAVGGSLICNWVGGTIPGGAPFPAITVTAIAGDREAYENCARVRMRKGVDQRPSNDADCATGRIEKPQGGRYNVGIRKDGHPSVAVGQTATFTIQVTNHGSSPVGSSVGLTVTDSVPVNFSNVTAGGVGWNCIVAGSQPSQVTCTYTGSPVNGGLQFPIITITGRVGKDGPWLNCAEAHFRKADDSNPRDNRDCAEGRGTEGDTKGYDLGIRKGYKPPSEPGGPAIFQLYPFNNGPSSVSAGAGVQVIDTLPANFAPQITAQGTNWSCATNGGPPWSIVCDYVGPPVGPGPLPMIEISADVREPGKFTNCAEIRLRKDRDLNPRDNRSCVDGEVSGGGGKKPDINITKTALKQPWAWPSGTGVYQFKISNVGDTAVPAGHVFTLTENLPAGMVLISTPNAWNCAPGAGTVGAATVTCTYASTAALNPGAFIQFDMTVGFDGKKEPRYNNCASVAVSGRDRPWREVNMENNRDCEMTEVGGGGGYFNIGIDKTGPSSLIIGQTGTYTLAVSNASTSPLDLNTYTPPPYVTVYTPVITVTDTLPAMFDPPVSVNGGPNWSCTAAGLAVTCTYVGGGIIPSGGPLPLITVSATVGRSGSQNNCATAGLGGGWFIVDMVPANNTDCVPITVRPPTPTMNLQVSKSVYGTWLPFGGDFLIEATNTSGATVPAGTTLTITDTLPPGMRFDGDQGAFSCSPVGVVGPATVTCTVTLATPLMTGQSVSAYLTMALIAPVATSYENCISLSASVPETSLADNVDCATLTSIPPMPPSLIVEKVVEQDCSGTYPYTACKFMVRIFNTGGTPYTGPLTFTDTVTGPSGFAIGGVSLASPLPPGWTCTGTQPATCTIPSATIPPNGGYITVPLYMTINGAIPPQQNCAVLTAPVPAQACVPMGSTHFDLGLNSSIVETDLALNGATFEFLVSSTPTLANGAQLIFNGSVVTPATFVPAALAPVVVSGTPLWSCSGPWSGFICSLNVTPGAWSGGLIPLRLKVYYQTFHVGLPVTFTGQIQMNGNADPVQSNNSTTVTTVLP
jgi:uncharacterized repeat protein (TIGR01451 family)